MYKIITLNHAMHDEDSRVGKILSSHVSCIVLSMLKMLCTKFEFRAACSQ